MKIKTIATIAAASFLPLAAFAQTPATPATPVTPAVPAVPPVPPVPSLPALREKAPKVPTTFLGVETSSVPNVVAEQLGLTKGFGLVIDYVVPDGPAAAAGLQPNDILKMLNDQILVEPDQLAKLVRSFGESTSVTLTVLRKGAEIKLTAKLAKREMPQRRDPYEGRMGRQNFGFGPEFQEQMEQLSKMKFDNIQESVANAREIARAARDQAREQARATAEHAREIARGIRTIVSNDNGALKTTRIDLGKAQIVYSDGQGEMTLETVDGKKMLTAKDPQGRLLFSGPVASKEEMEKIPAEVRQRFEKLEQRDLPGLSPKISKDNDIEVESESENDGDDDAESHASLQHTSAPVRRQFPYQRLGANTILI